jgi:hypothetical protein
MVVSAATSGQGDGLQTVRRTIAGRRQSSSRWEHEATAMTGLRSMRVHSASATQPVEVGERTVTDEPECAVRPRRQPAESLLWSSDGHRTCVSIWSPTWLCRGTRPAAGHGGLRRTLRADCRRPAGKTHRLLRVVDVSALSWARQHESRRRACTSSPAAAGFTAGASLGIDRAASAPGATPPRGCVAVGTFAGSGAMFYGSVAWTGEQGRTKQVRCRP